ncbi:hypothetical protein P5V15_001163 [Pogonomyrmex californicus]
MPAGMRILIRMDILISAYLSTLLGFCVDYNCMMINARHKLILIRSGNNNNCLMKNSALDPVIDLFKIQCRMLHVLLSEIKKLSMLHFGEQTIPEHDFSLVRSVRISVVTAYNQAFVGH